VVSAQSATEIDESRLAIILEVILARRSWKPAAMDPAREVPPDLLERLLESACWAPTHGMVEPWRFVVFTGEARRRLALELPAVYDAVTPPDQVRAEKREKLGLIFLQAPVVIAVAVVPDPRGKIPEVENIMAVACALQNLHLAASAAGLAAMWSTPPVVYAEAAKPILELGPDERCLGLFFLGWPRAGVPVPVSQRRPWREKARWSGERNG
jgi:nitroreductase